MKVVAKYVKNPIRLHVKIDGKIQLVAIGGDYKNDDGSVIKESKRLYPKLAKDYPHWFEKNKTKQE